jgi:hypothetical protein
MVSISSLGTTAIDLDVGERWSRRLFSSNNTQLQDLRRQYHSLKWTSLWQFRSLDGRAFLPGASSMSRYYSTGDAVQPPKPVIRPTQEPDPIDPMESMLQVRQWIRIPIWRT